MPSVDRCWLLTSNTYGAWLPGDRRGSVTRVRGDAGPRAHHNVPGTPAEPPMPALERAARSAMKEPAVWLTPAQATLLLAQFVATARHRTWTLFAAAVMRNHVHIVVGVPGDPDPATLLRDFKAYGSRALNRARGRKRRWWTEGGSRRVLPGEAAVSAAMAYVRDQWEPLATYVDRRRVRAAE